MPHVPDSSIQAWVAKAENTGLFTGEGFSENVLQHSAVKSLLYPLSVQKNNQAVYALLKMNGQNIMGIFGNKHTGVGFEGTERNISPDLYAFFCPLTHKNAVLIRKTLPFTAPSLIAGTKATIGLGDRLGIAGPGHIRMVRGHSAAPVLAQQSIRETDLTQRTYEDVLDSSTWAVFQEGYTGPWGADGDHIKTEERVRKILKVGFTMITADVSDHLKNEISVMTETEILNVYKGLDEDYRKRIEKKYLPVELELDTGESIAFSNLDLARISLTYKEAIEHAERLYNAAVDEKGEDAFDFELSVDESSAPTSPQAHLFIANEICEANIKVSSVAPRFVGEFQKAIDYIGDLDAFKRSFRTHAALARYFGYKISVHSGSDKFSVFPVIGELSRGRFHIKTSGTNWLEAVKVIARKDPGLYRELHRKALLTFDRATKYYHVTTNIKKVPDLSTLRDGQLHELFNNPDARQLIHITYGEILSDPLFKERFFYSIEKHIEEYWKSLEAHVGRHLDLLGV